MAPYSPLERLIARRDALRAAGLFGGTGGASESTQTQIGGGDMQTQIGGGEVQTLTTGGDCDFWYLYDANGNVGQLLRYDAGTSAVSLAAAYEYDPYGNTLVVRDIDNSGIATANKYRFSTKRLIDDLAASGQGGAVGASGLYYYGYRFYSPGLGRWVSRDPIGERGGANLMIFVDNLPLSRSDVLGLWGKDVHNDDTKKWAKECGFTDRCATILANADEDVDNYFKGSSPMYFTGDFRYHFDTDKDGGNPSPGARDERVAFEEGEAKKVLEFASSFKKVEAGLIRVGRSLHPLQDKYSHNADHHAATPFDHAPKTQCTAFFQDPFGTKEPVCIDALSKNPNWHDEHLPDKKDKWKDDHEKAKQATVGALGKWLEIPSVSCYCKQ